MSLVEGVVTDWDFFLDKALKTRTGHPYDPAKDKDGSKPGYRHIKRDNTTFGLVDGEGNVELHVRFCDCYGIGRTEIIPQVISRYGELYYRLTQAGINPQRDKRFEDAIRTAAQLISE